MSLRNKITLQLIAVVAVSMILASGIIYYTTVTNANFQVYHAPHDVMRLQSTLVLITSASIALVTVVGWVFSGIILKPLLTLIHEARRITVNSLDIRLNPGKERNELFHLAYSFNTMLARLQDAFRMQKNFIANASHEIRTPITSVILQLEVGLMNENVPPAYRKKIESMLDDMRKLQVLTDRLLLLAQVSQEPKKQKTIFQPFRLDEAVWTAKDDVLRMHPEYSIHIHFDEQLDDESKWMVNGDEALIRTALMNLIENGCKYSPNQHVLVSVRYYFLHLTLQVINKGTISHQEAINLFEPFYRGENVSTRPGHGIGLSLVKGIFNIHNFQLYLLTHSDHVIFKSRIPLANSSATVPLI